MAENIKTPVAEEPSEGKNFIQAFIEEDIAEGGQFQGMTVHTRFPPEPNGYLHIGHCKALTIDFGMAEKFHGMCNLRMDDTNPTKEDTEYVDAIQEDIRWLGFTWDDRFYYASDYFDKMYECAEDLIRKGLAYVCELTPEQMREMRGDLTHPAVSPYRDRPVEESLDLFRRMKAGEFENGRMTLRAKIDLASGNFNMRDPVIYRINHMPHHRTGDKWCIYPMYDFAHPIEDAMEHITHSLCSLEFEAHRPLYNWVVEHCDLPAKPRQIEFARLGINYTVMSKRKLRQLVEENRVSGWDDPRMPTLCAMRRRGYTPESIRDFIDRIGVAKADSTVDLALLEHCVREDLGEKAPRAMAVLRPLKVILTNWPQDRRDELEMENHPNHPEMGTHKTVLTREIYVEREDFMENPPRKYFRLFPGNEVRLKGAYIIRCDGCEKDAEGNVTAVLCTVDMDTRNGTEGANRKVKGTLHWVSAEDCIPVEARLYEPLLMDEDALAKEEAEADAEAQAEAEGVEAAPVSSATLKTDFLKKLNPDSLEVSRGYAERFLGDAQVGDTFQFLRMGYFCKDPDSTDALPVFNRVVGLKDSFAKQVKG